MSHVRRSARLLLVAALLAGCAARSRKNPSQADDYQSEWDKVNRILSHVPIAYDPKTPPGVWLSLEKRVAKLREAEPSVEWFKQRAADDRSKDNRYYSSYLNLASLLHDRYRGLAEIAVKEGKGGLAKELRDTSQRYRKIAHPGN